MQIAFFGISFGDILCKPSTTKLYLEDVKGKNRQQAIYPYQYALGKNGSCKITVRCCKSFLLVTEPTYNTY
jgi:hypothetical protein